MTYWTSNSETVVRRMFADGYSDAVIAERLGRSPLAIEKRRSDMRLMRKPGRGVLWTAEHDAQLRSLVAQGLPYSRIAIELNAGFSRNACIGRAKRIGLSTPIKPPAEFKRARFRGVNTVEKINHTRHRTKRSLPPDPVPELSYSTEFLGVSLFDLDKDMCRFPKGEGINTLFCGQPVKPDSSWCQHCSKIVFTKPYNLTPEDRERRRIHGNNLSRKIAAKRAGVSA